MIQCELLKTEVFTCMKPDAFPRVLAQRLQHQKDIDLSNPALVSVSSIPLHHYRPRKMQLVFNTSDYMNTSISDEQGHVLYSVSTPDAAKRITTITKYRWRGRSSVSETMATIEWHMVKETLFRFNGDEIKADTMLGKRRWSTYVRPIRPHAR